MIFRPYYYLDLGCAACLFGCGSVGKGAVVDARADDVDEYIAEVPLKPAEVERVLAFNRGHHEAKARHT
jgi:hypothetical protein